MFTETHLNGTYYKYHQIEGNTHLLFLLPGQSLSARAFWEFNLPENKTHVDYFLQSGIDVILFDPIGYGKSTEFYNYDRIDYAKQITEVTKQIKKSYETKTIFGFSTSTAPALIAGQNDYFNKVIIHSPLVRQLESFIQNYDADQEYLHITFDFLLNERIAKVSDAIIPKSNKISGWIESVKKISGENWRVPYQVVNDIHTYWPKNQMHAIPSDKVIDTLAIVGQFDNELKLSQNCYKRFREMYPHAVEVIIPDSTHFSMWENNSRMTRNVMINFIKDN